ncbi:MAG: hypothetical protein RQ722_03390 [Desulfuromonadales bacterium]|nr:hypothetical protein [Desulfuromonadales bacterium]
MHRDNVLNVLQQSEEKRARFLTAWKHGVDYLGSDFFGPGTSETARCKEELSPVKEVVDAAFERESEGEEQFLAAMVSFYDPAWGEELANRIVCHKSLCGLTFDLDHECTAIVCELLLNYEGW